MFKDINSRNQPVYHGTYRTVLALILIIIGSVWLSFSLIRYHKVVTHSSTATGTTMTFQRSSADVKLQDVFTDRKKDVLVARLKIADGANTKLPYRGTDYRVFVSSKALKGYKETTVLFSRMSTDGTLIFVLPKPTKDVYSIFIMNTKFLNTDNITADDSASSNSSNSADDDDTDADDSDITDSGMTGSTQTVQDQERAKASITQALSNYKYRANDKTSTTYQVADDYTDFIGFRLTIDPAFRTSKYLPHVLNTDLINSDNEFNYEAFYNLAYRDSAINANKARYKELQTKIDQVKQTQSELNSRLKDNPGDDDASTALQSVTKQLDDLNTAQLQITKKIEKYRSTKFSKQMFSHVQTKATVIQPH